MSDWVPQHRFTALVIADADGAATRAVALAGGQARRIGWEAASDALGGVPDAAVLLIEAAGVSDGALDAVLPAIARAAAGGLPVIVALDPAQIDRIAADLLDDGVQLLCAPDLPERVAALAIAAARERAPRGGVREGEEVRLARLSAEVARIADLLARLVRDEPGAQEAVGERRPAFDAGPAASGDPDITAAEVRALIRARRLRDRHFGRGLFEDPAWDMMLDLFAAHLERSAVSVSSLCIAAAVAPTTVLRWIGRMTTAGLVVRTPDPADRRRAFMTLTPRAVAGMTAHFTGLRALGLPLA